VNDASRSSLRRAPSSSAVNTLGTQRITGCRLDAVEGRARSMRKSLYRAPIGGETRGAADVRRSAARPLDQHLAQVASGTINCFVQWVCFCQPGRNAGCEHAAGSMKPGGGYPWRGKTLRVVRGDEEVDRFGQGRVAAF